MKSDPLNLIGQPTGSKVKKEKLLVATQWQLMRWKFAKHKVAIASLVFLVIMYMLVLFGEFFSPYDPSNYDKRYLLSPPVKLHFSDENTPFRLKPFVYERVLKRDMKMFRIYFTENTSRKFYFRWFVRGWDYKLLGLIPMNLHLFGVEEGGRLFLFGTDEMGRDIFSRVIYGARISLSIGLVGVAISFFLGILIGGVSGYFGGTVDVVIQRIIEALMTIPKLPLWMGLSVAVPSHWTIVQTYFAITIILSILGWTGLARVVRGKFLALKEEDFVLSAKVHGASELRLIFKYMLPSFLSHIIAALTMSIPGIILAETSLSFLGLGLQPPAISWGVLLNDAQEIKVLAYSPWILIPGIFIVVTVLAYYFVGDALRDAADPYSTA